MSGLRGGFRRFVMAYELGGKKKRPWWDMLLESFGVGVGVGGGASAPGGTDLRTSLFPATGSMFLGGGPATPGAQTTLLGESPAAAPAARTPGMFTERGVTYGEESIGLPPEERVALDPEEIARRRKAFKPGRSGRAAKRRETLLGELGPEGTRRRILGAPSKLDVSWRKA